VDYYQGVVVEYLRADRSVFVNTECFIQIADGNSPGKGKSWYCDAVAVNLKTRSVFLCEVSYSKSLFALRNRLTAWNSHWSEIKSSLVRDCGVDETWHVTPWLFIPQESEHIAKAWYESLATNPPMPCPKIHALESVAPWKYCAWNRQEKSDGPGSCTDTQ